VAGKVVPGPDPGLGEAWWRAEDACARFAPDVVLEEVCRSSGGGWEATAWHRGDDKRFAVGRGPTPADALDALASELERRLL